MYPAGFDRRMYSSNSGLNLRIAFLIGQAAPSANPQMVVPGMMPMLSPISRSKSRSNSLPLPAVMQEVDHRNRVIQHNDGGGTKSQAAKFGGATEIEAAVEFAS